MPFDAAAAYEVFRRSFRLFYSRRRLLFQPLFSRWIRLYAPRVRRRHFAASAFAVAAAIAMPRYFSRFRRFATMVFFRYADEVIDADVTTPPLFSPPLHAICHAVAFRCRSSPLTLPLMAVDFFRHIATP